MNKFPKSIQEACEILYAQLAPEEVEQIRAGKVDATDMHFSLGLWIRNNWIYKGLAPETLGFELMSPDADDFSDEILKVFIKYIKKSK